MIVLCRTVTRTRGFDAGAFTDITAIPLVGDPTWDTSGGLVVEFTADVTPQVVRAVRVRVASDSPDQEQLIRLGLIALATNDTYLALSPPTTGQAVAQVAALTRQVSGIINALAGPEAS